jgi:hypothetical protein
MAFYDEKFVTVDFQGKQIGADMGVCADNFGGTPFVGIGETSPIYDMENGKYEAVKFPKTAEGDNFFNAAIQALAAEYKKVHPEILEEWAEKWHKPIV